MVKGVPTLRKWTVICLGRLGVAIAVILGIGGVTALQIGGLGSPPAAASPAVTPTIWTVNQNSSTLVAHPLSATGNATPAVTISAHGTSLDEPFGTEAFDASGDMWIANLSSNTLVEYTPSQLTTSGNPIPAVTISSNAGSLDVPGSVAFDRSGDLWASNEKGHTVVEYTPGQLVSSGNPKPAVTLSGIQTPYGFAFDGSGDLWVTAINNSTVIEYTPGQLASSGSPTPAVTLSTNASSSLKNPSAVAFDASHDLWVTNSGNSTLVEYTPGQLASSGDPTPAVTISGLDSPYSLAFDAAGDLWVPNFDGLNLVEYTPNQLTTSGSPTPANTISGPVTGLDSPGGVVIKEAPTVTSIAPPAGEPAGGTAVTINGTGFNYGSTVDFGSAPATSVTYLSPYQLRAVSPPGVGTVDVTVSTFAGTSSVSAADQFSYTSSGYWQVASDGGIFAFNAPFFGSMGGTVLNAPVVGMAPATAGSGYWEVAKDGGIFAFGPDAIFRGSMGGRELNAPIVGMAADPATGGYWEVASDGGIFAFGAPFLGSTGGMPLNAPIVGMAAAPDGTGYWLVASDGGIFAFGAGAVFHGSMGGKPLNKPIVAMTAAPSGGYWEVASDGGIFAFGAPFLGSTGGMPLNKPMVGIGGLAGVNGYWEVASDGGIFSFGVPFVGSMGGKPLNAPVVGMAGG